MITNFRVFGFRSTAGGTNSWVLILFQFLFSAVAAQNSDGSTLILGVRGDAPPFSYKTDASDDGYAGYTVDLCKRIAERAIQDKLYCAKTFVEVTAHNRFQKLRDGEIHMICGATTATLQRSRSADFSLFTFLSGASVMYRESPPNGNDSNTSRLRIGVLEGTTTEKEAKRIVKDHRQRNADGLDETVTPAVTEVGDHLSGLEKLRKGEIDIYLADREILLALKERNASSQAQQRQPIALSVSEKYYTFEPYAIAISAGNKELRFVVNTVLSQLFDWETQASSELPLGIFTVLDRNLKNKLYSESLAYLFRIQRLQMGQPLPDVPPPVRRSCE